MSFFTLSPPSFFIGYTISIVLYSTLETDLATVCPNLVEEWHTTKKGNLKPCDITARCNQKVWWKCKNGHSYACIVALRNKGIGCTYCSGRYILTVALPTRILLHMISSR
ncbi:zinc-ribbon domain-containing protein [Pseudobutyrivibrio sp.]